MFALKEVEFEDEQGMGLPAFLIREISMLKKLSKQGHPNLVGITKILPQFNKIFLIMEFCPYDISQLMQSWRADPENSPLSSSLIKYYLR